MPSPFGIRRRIKRLLGRETPAAAAEAETAKVSLILIGPDGNEQRCQAPAGSSLLSASGALKRPVAAGCSDSTCGTCRVEILEGSENLSPQQPREKATLKQNGHPMNLRLSCITALEKETVKAKAFELI